VKRGLIIFTVELPPHAKNDKTTLKKSAAWEVISSSTVIPKVSF
jgi:hypothetical protein